jgi:23S rRNA G2445 N2-methylase RlmL
LATTENNLKITATCSSGLEEVLQKEIETFGADIESTGKNTVQFYADMQLLYKLNMASRTATHFFLFL